MVIIALAGRRVDKEGETHVRFPGDADSVARVGERIRAYLADAKATTLVCSAACGADLLGLEEAGKLGLTRRVILPFEPARFRASSVADRPGDWGPLFDRIIEEVSERGGLILAPAQAAHSVYLETNHVIIEEALRLAAEVKTTAAAVLVWDGTSRGDGDATEEFGRYARSRSMTVGSIPTL